MPNDRLLYVRADGATVELFPADSKAVIQNKGVTAAQLTRPDNSVGQWVVPTTALPTPAPAATAPTPIVIPPSRSPVATPTPVITPVPVPTVQPQIVVGNTPPPVAPVTNVGQSLAGVTNTLSLVRGQEYFTGSLTAPRDGISIVGVGDLSKPLPVLRFANGVGIDLRGRSGITIKDVELRSDAPTNVGLHLAATRSIVLDGLRVSGFTFGATLENGCSDVKITRCVFFENYNPAGHSSGLYSDMTTSLVLDSNVFDSNGWKAGVAGAAPENQGVYLLGASPPAVVTNNVFSRNSNFGLQCRCGGIVQGNLFLDQPHHLSYGLVNGLGPVHPAGVMGEVNGNVLIGTAKVAGAYGVSALWLSNIYHATVANNLIAHGTGAQGPAITVQPCGLDAANAYVKSGGPDGKPVGVVSLTFDGNSIWDWPNAPFAASGLSEAETGNHHLGVLTEQAKWNPSAKTPNLRAMLGTDDPVNPAWKRFRTEGAGNLPAVLANLFRAVK